MELTRSSYMQLCSVVWDINHDPTEKRATMEYLPQIGLLEIKFYLSSDENAHPDTVYHLREDERSLFSQFCDPANVAEMLRITVKEPEEWQ